MQRCGSIWACPPCAAKVRNHRAGEVTRMALEHINRGGVMFLVTLTARHHAGDSLPAMLAALPKAYGNLTSGGAWSGNTERNTVGERDRLGVVGWCRSLEITYGENGWHPHLHVLLFLEAEPDTLELAAAIARWDATWRRDLRRHGFEPSRQHGVKWDRCVRPTEAAEYVTKSQDGKKVGTEVARGDLKSGRLGSVTPFQLLEYFKLTGDAAAVDIWHDYERATKGRRAITWSQGIRTLLLPDEDELSDEEVAEQEVGGETVATFGDDAWRVVVEVEGMYAAVLRAAESGGYQAVVSLLVPFGVQPDKPAPE